MRKWMVDFFRKRKNHGIKISPVNSFLITKSVNLQLTLILYGVGVRCDRRRFTVHSPFIELVLWVGNTNYGLVLKKVDILPQGSKI